MDNPSYYPRVRAAALCRQLGSFATLARQSCYYFSLVTAAAPLWANTGAQHRKNLDKVTTVVRLAGLRQARVPECLPRVQAEFETSPGHWCRQQPGAKQVTTLRLCCCWALLYCADKYCHIVKLTSQTAVLTFSQNEFPELCLVSVLRSQLGWGFKIQIFLFEIKE